MSELRQQIEGDRICMHVDKTGLCDDCYIADLERQLKEATFEIKQAKEMLEQRRIFNQELQQQLQAVQEMLIFANGQIEIKDKALQAANERADGMERAGAEQAIRADQNQSELTQLRQERDKLQKQLDEGSSDVLDMLADERDTLRAENERLKDGHVKLVLMVHQRDARVQRLEGALKKAGCRCCRDYVPIPEDEL